jgi:signal transduction histidine kinase
MTGLRGALWGLAVLGLAAGIALTALVAGGDQEHDHALNVVFGPLIGWSFIGTGLFAWWRRPHNHFGALMTAVGFAYLVGSLTESGTPGVYVTGALFSALPFGFLIHLLLAFPSGRLEGRAAKVLAAWAYVEVTVGQVATVLVYDPRGSDCDCPAPNPLLVVDDRGLQDFMTGLQGTTSALGLALIAALLWRRWRGASPAQRRALTPMYLAGGVTMVLLAITLTADVTGFDNRVERMIDIVSLVTLLAVPYGFLTGLLRSRMARGGAVSELMRRVGSGGAARDSRMRDLLAETLEDPSIELAYWLPERERWVHEDGREMTLPAAGERRSMTEVERDGRRVAAILHDPALDDERDLVRAAGATVALAIENERLDAELRARVEELRTSRERLVQAGLDERRRLERDLHDGAQQRLVSLRLSLGMARERAGSDPELTARLLAGALEELDAALAELRELARGIHPAVLTDHGLEPALSALADRAPLPVDLRVDAGPLPRTAEAAAYFTVAEALTNVAKYAQASSASVSVGRRNGHAVVEVRDDGVGGADPGRGSGLSGLADRLAALDGRLSVESPAGAGTVLRAEIPCE